MLNRAGHKTVFHNTGILLKIFTFSALNSLEICFTVNSGPDSANICFN